jgi:hypothetical protein
VRDLQHHGFSSGIFGAIAVAEDVVFPHGLHASPIDSFALRELPVAEQATDYTDYADSEPIKQHLRFRIPRNPCNPWLAFFCWAKPSRGLSDELECP